MLRVWGVAAVRRAELFIALLSVAVCCCAAQDKSVGSTLDVQVFVHDQNGTPAEHLHTGNFRFFQKEKRLDVEMLRAKPGGGPSGLMSVPTRMLVLVAPAMEDTRDSTKGVLTALEPVWSDGWEIAAGESDGNVTRYASSGADLQKMWTPEGLRVAGVPARAALGNLRSFQGRSLVIYVTGRSRFSVPEKWLAAGARAAGAELLLVDGGAAGEEESIIHSYIDSESNLSVPGPHPIIPWQEMPEEVALAQVARDPGTVWHTTRSRAYWRGVFHEVNLRAAVREAVRGAAGFYDLRVTSREGRPVASDAILLMELRGVWGLEVEERMKGGAELPQLAVERR